MTVHRFVSKPTHLFLIQHPGRREKRVEENVGFEFSTCPGTQAAADSEPQVQGPVEPPTEDFGFVSSNHSDSEPRVQREVDPPAEGFGFVFSNRSEGRSGPSLALRNVSQ
jgi:hypothetical protein